MGMCISNRENLMVRIVGQVVVVLNEGGYYYCRYPPFLQWLDMKSTRNKIIEKNTILCVW
jgi:hypothetical protein